jgi:phosphomannomutase
MAEAPLMLGVSGVRGIVGESLTIDVACRFGAAFGSWLADRIRAGAPVPGRARWDPAGEAAPAPVVVVGRDGRAGGEELLECAVIGLRSVGCRVLDAGVLMTPSAGVLVDDLRADGALLVTASHNPQQWNGLKCIIWNPPEIDGAAACAPPADLAWQIIERFKSIECDPDAAGGSREPAPAQAHLDNLLIAIDPVTPGAEPPIGAGVRVALDSVNASGRELGAQLVKSLGCTLFHYGAEATGVFPHEPEPTRENLTELAAMVKAHGADVGFAQDPDADRLAIIDERGQYIGEEYTLVLAAMALLDARADEGAAGNSAGPPVIVTNLSTSRMIDDIAAAAGAEVVRTPVGEANVVEAMKRLSAEGRRVILGGEGNGGVIWPKVTLVRDSLSAMALALALRARRQAPISQIVRQIPRYAIEKRKAPLARREDALPALARLRAHFEQAPGDARPRIDEQDGLRLDFDARRAWLHVRPSNTEPICRLIAEAPDPAAAASLLDEAERAMAG